MNYSILQNSSWLFDLAVQTYKDEKGLIGIDIGFRYGENNEQSDQLAVRVHFFNRDANDLKKPNGGDAIQLIVYRWQKQASFSALPNWNRYRKHVHPGLSFGCKSERGSVGLLGRDKKRGNTRAMLTCQHLFLGCTSRTGHVYQPLPSSARDSAYIRYLGRWERRLPNSDAAIIHLKPKTKRRFTNQIDLGQNKSQTISRLRNVQLGDVLTKAGSTTGITQAKVDGLGLYFPHVSGLPFSIPSFRLVPVPDSKFSQRGIAAGGDSGAIWFDQSSGEGVGLHIAGNVGKNISTQFAYALHLTRVCDDIGFVPKP